MRGASNKCVRRLLGIGTALTGCGTGSSPVANSNATSVASNAERSSVRISGGPLAALEHPDSALQQGGGRAASEVALSRQCGDMELQLSCQTRSGSADCMRTALILKKSTGEVSEIIGPKEMANYTAVGVACASSARDSKSYFAVQYGELPFGCGFCEWLYLYDSDGRQLTESDPPFLFDKSLPGNDKRMPNNREFGRLSTNLMLGPFDFEFISRETRLDDEGNLATSVSDGGAQSYDEAEPTTRTGDMRPERVDEIVRQVMNQQHGETFNSELQCWEFTDEGADGDPVEHCMRPGGPEVAEARDGRQLHVFASAISDAGNDSKHVIASRWGRLH